MFSDYAQEVQKCKNQYSDLMQQQKSCRHQGLKVDEQIFPDAS